MWVGLLLGRLKEPINLYVKGIGNLGQLANPDIPFASNNSAQSCFGDPDRPGELLSSSKTSKLDEFGNVFAQIRQ